MFNTKGQEVKSTTVSKSLVPGVEKCRILSMTVRTSSKKDKKVLDLYLIGEESPTFEGWNIDKDNPNSPKYKGPTGKVTATSWTDTFNKTNAVENEILSKVLVIAQEMGLRQEIDNIAAGSIEEWVKQAETILVNSKKQIYFFLKGTEEEYNGKTIVKLSLPKYKFCSADESKLDVFDKSNVYHFKALPVNQVSSFSTSEFDV